MLTTKLRASFNRRHFLRLSALSAITSTTISWPREARADRSAGNAFDTGLYLGFASYQASVGQYDLANDAINKAQIAYDNLANSIGVSYSSILANLDKYADMHTGLIRERRRYEANIRQIDGE